MATRLAHQPRAHAITRCQPDRTRTPAARSGYEPDALLSAEAVAPPGASRIPLPIGAGGATAILRLQQILGNFAVQRLAREGSLTLRAVGATVQREEDESILPSWTIGDWNIGPPKPAMSTDDRYDTPQNQDRAEQNDADARSNDPNPYEWWKPQQPGEPGPLLPTNESSPVQNELPPPEPEQPGDYPYPLQSEEERYA
jgi:hypothetical protein